MKITTVTHVRSLSGLELQAVEMALEESPLSALNGAGDLTFSLGTENGTPFVAITREGSNHEVVIHFENKHKTADERRKDERAGAAGTAKKGTSRPAVKAKPAAVKPGTARK
jgi:hypothetical protein